MKKANIVLSNESKNNTPTSNNKLLASIIMSYNRTGISVKDDEMRLIVSDVIKEFKGVIPFNIVIESIRKGSLGYFGVNYKMTSQVVCYWIREGYKLTDEYKKKQSTFRAGDPTTW